MPPGFRGCDGKEWLSTYSVWREGFQSCRTLQNGGGWSDQSSCLKGWISFWFWPLQGALVSFLPLNWPTEAPASPSPGSTSQEAGLFSNSGFEKGFEDKKEVPSLHASSLLIQSGLSLSLKKLASAAAAEMLQAHPSCPLPGLWLC